MRSSLKTYSKTVGLNSVESEISLRKLLFLGRMITENKLTPTVRNLFHTELIAFFDESISSSGILPSICEALHRYELFDYFESWFHNSTFPNYSSWKTSVKNKTSVLWITKCAVGSEILNCINLM